MLVSAIACIALAVSAAPDREIRIGSLRTMTGELAPLGVAQRQGAMLAAEELNAAGGVLGRTLVIVEADDGGQADQGARAAKDLVEVQQVQAVIGPASEEAANASAKITNAAHVPHVNCASSGALVNEWKDRYPENYVFRLAASDEIIAHMMLTEAFAARERTRPTILVDESLYGQNGRLLLERAVRARGTEVLPYWNVLKPGETAKHIQNARESDSDVILVYTLGPEAMRLARELERVGWRVDLIGSWTLSHPVFVEESGAFGEGAVFPQTFIEYGHLEPYQQAFVDRYKARWKAERIEAPTVAAQAYDAVRLLAAAMQQAGTTDGPAVRRALEDLEVHYEGATGEYYKPWEPGDHEAVTPANVVWARVKGGKIVPAYPER